MTEKMTDEELETLQHIASGEDETWDDRWRAWMKKATAHIAALTAELKNLRAVYEEGRGERDGMRSRIAAIRQRACDTKALVEAHQSGMGCASVARYILGDDAPAPSEMSGLEGEMAGPCGNCAGVQPETCATHVPTTSDAEAAMGRVVSLLEHVERAQELAAGYARKESTTSEAFATVRNGLMEHGEHSVGCTARRHKECHCHIAELMAALSLLELRMGAQEAALRALLSDHGHTPECGYSGYRDHQCSDACAGARAAFADAPPVFTLEEVLRVASTYVPPKYRADLRHDLESLRR